MTTTLLPDSRSGTYRESWSGDSPGSGSPVPFERPGIAPSVSSAPAEVSRSRIYVISEASEESDELLLLVQKNFEAWEKTAANFRLYPYLWKFLQALRAEPARILAPQDQLDDVVMTFSLNATQTADVLRVSREAVYKWRRGGAMRQQTRSRLNQLYEFSQFYQAIDPRPIGPALTWIDGSDGESLLDLLSAEKLDPSRIRRRLKALPKQLEDQFAEANALAAANDADGWAEVPEAWRRETRLYASGRATQRKEPTP